MRARPRASSVVAVAMLTAASFLVVVVPFLPFYDAYALDLSQALTSPLTDPAHPLGTDGLGRDTLSRLSLAGRVSILIAVPALLLNMLVGVTFGFLAGYFGGAAEAVTMGFADLQLSMPLLVLLVMIVAIVGSGPVHLAVILGVTYWVGFARVARVVALSLREREFVLAARTFGATSTWVMREHLLPHLVPQLAIMGSFGLGVIIILEAGLSYLGLGVQAPTPSWGGMILEGQDHLQTAPWLALLPASAIFLVVGGVQILSQRFTKEGSGPATAPEGRAA